jgi:glycosyltransferase involved in cell wall biosynthesis
MRICHVSPHLPPDQAANALLPAELGAWFRAAGHDVAFVTQPAVQGAATPADRPAGPVLRVDARRSSSRLARWTRVGTWRRVCAVMRALDDLAADADLLHLHSNGLIIEAAALWASRRRIPFVLTLYGTEIWHYRARRPIDPFTRAYQRAAAVTFYSEGLLERARELGLGRAGLSVIYPAVRPVFTPASEAGRRALGAQFGLPDAGVVLNVKRLHELAGHRYLIEAFARIASRHPQARLIICGTGALRAELEGQAHACGIAPQVTFTGLIGNDVVARYAAAADVFALPSLLEALPTVAVEALACGTPVVSADHPGGNELHALFDDDVAVVPRRDVDALARGLEAALIARRRTTERTAAIIEARFSVPAVQTAYGEVYRRVISEAAGTAARRATK